MTSYIASARRPSPTAGTNGQMAWLRNQQLSIYLCPAGEGTLLPLGLATFVRPFSDAADGRSPLATGADDGGASPAHVLAPPRPPMMRAHPSALPLGIRAVP